MSIIPDMFWNDLFSSIAHNRIRDYVHKTFGEETDFDWKPDGFYNETTNRVRIFVNGKRYTRYVKW